MFCQLEFFFLAKLIHPFCRFRKFEHTKVSSLIILLHYTQCWHFLSHKRSCKKWWRSDETRWFSQGGELLWLLWESQVLYPLNSRYLSSQERAALSRPFLCISWEQTVFHLKPLLNNPGISQNPEKITSYMLSMTGLHSLPTTITKPEQEMASTLNSMEYKDFYLQSDFPYGACTVSSAPLPFQSWQCKMPSCSSRELCI